jgi:hypothetical protein
MADWGESGHSWQSMLPGDSRRGVVDPLGDGGRGQRRHRRRSRKANKAGLQMSFRGDDQPPQLAVNIASWFPSPADRLRLGGAVTPTSS